MPGWCHTSKKMLRSAYMEGMELGASLDTTRGAKMHFGNRGARVHSVTSLSATHVFYIFSSNTQ
jgi:hypothetical protein